MGQRRHNFRHAAQRYHREQEMGLRQARVRHTFDKLQANRNYGNAAWPMDVVSKYPRSIRFRAWWRRLWLRVTVR